MKTPSTRLRPSLHLLLPWPIRTTRSLLLCTRTLASRILGQFWLRMMTLVTSIRSSSCPVLSRTLKRNYTITELEYLAIVWSVQKLHVYLDGSKFTLITGHSALQWLFSFNGTNRRLIRWSLELQPYRDSMNIKYRAGRIHTNADPLSRAPLATINTVAIDTEIPVATCNNISAATVEADFLRFVSDGYAEDVYFMPILDDISGLTVQAPKLDITGSDSTRMVYSCTSSRETTMLESASLISPKPYNLRAQFLHDHHDAEASAHLGTNKTLNAVARKFYWPGMTRDVKDYVRSCNKCQLNMAGLVSHGLHQALPIPPHRWHTVTIDFARPSRIATMTPVSTRHLMRFDPVSPRRMSSDTTGTRATSSIGMPCHRLAFMLYTYNITPIGSSIKAASTT